MLVSARGYTGEHTFQIGANDGRLVIAQGPFFTCLLKMYNLAARSYALASLFSGLSQLLPFTNERWSTRDVKGETSANNQQYRPSGIIDAAQKQVNVGLLEDDRNSARSAPFGSVDESSKKGADGVVGENVTRGHGHLRLGGDE